MHDWNVVATTRDQEFRRARDLLSNGGSVSRTEFYNVLVMKVTDAESFLEWLEQQWSENADFARAVAHVRPARHTFDFHSSEEFEDKAREIALCWAPRVAGKAFHVWLHRRGFKGRLSTPEEERFLDAVLMERLSDEGAPARITFEDPDAILSIDTVKSRAGVSLWSREELRTFSFLGVD